MAIMLGYTEILLAFLCFLFLRHWRVNRNSRLTDWPIVGMLPSLSNLSKLPYLIHTLNTYGRTFQFRGPWFSNMNFLVTWDPMNVDHILRKSFSNYNKGPIFRETLDAFGDGIFSSDGEQWKHSKKIIQSLFKQKNFHLLLERSVQSKLKSSLLPLLDHFQDQGMEFNLQNVFNRFSYDNICSVVMGFDPNCLSITFPKVVQPKAFDQIFKTMFYRHLVPRSLWKLQKWLRVGQEKRMAEAREILDDFLEQRVMEKRKDVSRRADKILADKDQESQDLLTTLILEEKKLGIDEKFFKDTIFTLITAGRDTLTSGLTWFFWLVATHPLVETRILDEIKEKFPGKVGAQDQMILDAAEVKELVYLHGALCESLRLHPPVAFNSKYAVESDILPSGHHVSQNTMILLSFYAMGRLKELWGEDCLEFKPERWVSESGSLVHVPASKFVAFNAGPRICLGKDMSLIEMKMVAAAILWNYHIQVVKGHSGSPRFSLTTSMRNGLKVRVTKRIK